MQSTDGEQSQGALALAAVDGTFLLRTLHPPHHMREMPAMEAIGTPNQCIAQTLPTILGLDECTILLEFLSVSVVDSDGEETDGALGQHAHAVQAIHDLIPTILGEVVVALHAQLVLCEVFGDAFGEGEQGLAVLAVGTVEGKGLIHGLLLPLNLNRHALLVELVLGDAQVHPRQQELIVSDESTVKGHLAVLESDLALLQEQPQVDTHHGCLLHLPTLIHVVLKDHLRFPPGPKEDDVLQLPEGRVVLDDFALELLEVLPTQEPSRVKEAVSDGKLVDGEGGICFFDVIILPVAEEAGDGPKARVRKPSPQRGKVVGIEVQPLPNLSDLLVELPHLLATGLLPSLLVADGELLPLHEDLLQLLILHDHLVNLSEGLQAQFDSRHFRILMDGSDHTDEMKRLRKLEHPDTFEQLQVEGFPLLVQWDLRAVFDPEEETVAALHRLLKFLEEQTRRTIGHQLSVELLAQDVLEIGISVNFAQEGMGADDYP